MGLSSHQKAVGNSQTYLTPKWITDLLGPFDIDVCASTPRPWDIGKTVYVEKDDGLAQQWQGLVWCNPPFDTRGVGKWVERMADHDNGLLLVHARTETKWFQPIFTRALALAFFRGRLHFLNETGTPYPYNSGAPSVVAAFGTLAHERLQKLSPHANIVGLAR